MSSPNGMLLGIDADPDALTAARTHLAPFAGRFVLVESYFDDLEPVAREAGFLGADGVLFDLGVSSPQLGRAERGFSFQQDAPLDMRMGPQAGQTAANLVNSLSGAELQRIFQEYGEERYSGRIARRIVEARRQRPIQTTGELAEIVTRAKPRERHPEGSRPIHPATRVFQALRIAVNDELGRLRRALPQAVEVLAGREPDTELQPLAAGSRRAAARAEGPATSRGGRLAVITFHSLEDRIVKQFMRQEARGCICPPELPVCVCGRTPRLRVLTARPLVASEEEVAVNPRARSAKLRVAERISA